MMMRSTALALPLLIASAAGCQAVFVPAPLGEPVDPGDELNLTGVWQIDETILHAVHLDHGHLRVTQTEWTGDAFELTETAEGLVTEQAGVYYLHGKPPNREPDDPPYSLVRLETIDEQTIHLLLPNAAHFKAAVDDGTLPGRVVERGQVVEVLLEADAEALSAHITPDQVDAQFQTRNPIVLRRVGQVKTTEGEPAGDGGEGDNVDVAP